MSQEKKNREFVAYVVELMHGVGPATARRMFGGHGVFIDAVMFALIAERTLYLKTDAMTQALFTDKGLQPFTYHKNGKPCAMSYHQAPDEALESAEEMTVWGNLALSTAVRAAATGKRKQRNA